MALDVTGPVIKRSSEKRHWPVDWTKALATGDTVTGVWSIVVKDSAGVDVSDSMIAPGSKQLIGNILWALYQGGIDGQRYSAILQMTTANGEVLVESFNIDVKD